MELVNLEGVPIPVGATKDISEGLSIGNDQSGDLRETHLRTSRSILCKKANIPVRFYSLPLCNYMTVYMSC